MLADGQVVTLADGDDLLPAVRCHLGCLGLLTKVTVRLVPAFFLSCRIETFDAPDAFETILPHADANEYVNMLWVPDLDEAYVRILTRSDATARNDKALALEEKFVGRSQLGHRLEDVGFFAAAHAYQISPARVSRWYCGKVREAFFDDNGVVDASYRVFLYDQYREPTENHSLRMIMNVEYAFDTEVLWQILRNLRKLLADQRNDARHLNYPRVHVRFAPRSDATLIGLNADRRTAYVGIYVLGSVRGEGQIPLARAIEQLFVSHGGRPHWGKYSYLADSVLAIHTDDRSFAEPAGLPHRLHSTQCHFIIVRVHNVEFTGSVSLQHVVHEVERILPPVFARLALDDLHTRIILFKPGYEIVVTIRRRRSTENTLDLDYCAAFSAEKRL
jgi:hypothetical protein